VRLLLDTHALLWWLQGSEALSSKARQALQRESNTVFVSAASASEIAIKQRVGKLVLPEHIADLEAVIELEGFSKLPISVAHGLAAGRLPGPHRDPFDRMLIAQAILERMALVSNEERFDSYGVKRIW
jgi:PIN domain nuclease of toxin-antitoxin system